MIIPMVGSVRTESLTALAMNKSSLQYFNALTGLLQVRRCIASCPSTNTVTSNYAQTVTKY